MVFRLSRAENLSRPPPSAVLLDSMLRQAEEDAKIRVVHSPELSREEFTVI